MDEWLAPRPKYREPLTSEPVRIASKFRASRPSQELCDHQPAIEWSITNNVLKGTEEILAKFTQPLTCTKIRPFGAYWYEFLASIFIATWSFQANSSDFCQGASVFGNRNLTRTPMRKHCHTGVGMPGVPPKDQSGEAGLSKWPLWGRILKNEEEIECRGAGLLRALPNKQWIVWLKWPDTLYYLIVKRCH